MRPLHFGATLLATFALAACGSSDNGPSYAGAADSATIASLADNANDIIGTSFETTFQNGEPSLPLPAAGSAHTTESRIDYARATIAAIARKIGADRGITLSAPERHLLSSAPFSECTPTETGVDELGDPVDTDGDNVPDNYKVNYGSACTEEDSAGTSRTTVSGFIQIQDVETGFYGFKATVGNLKFIATDLTTGESVTFAVNGSETFDAAAALASHHMTFSYGLTSHTPGSPDVSVTVSDAENSTFDPDNGLSLSLANPLPNGVLDMNVDLRILGFTDASEQTGNFRLVLDTPTPVHYNTACGTSIDAGQLRGLLNGNSNIGFTATWSSCADPVVVIFGDTPAATVAAR